VREGEYLQEEYGEKILHSYFDENEAEDYFSGYQVIYKENRIRNGFQSEGVKIRRGYIDYIIEKK